jgi:hypothetical protein
VDTASAVQSLSKLIAAGKAEAIQEQAATLLGLVVSNFPDAKLEAVKTDCVPKLIALIAQGNNVLLALAATTALMMITVVNEGKWAVVKCEGGVASLAGKWLDPELSEKLCANLTQCITNVAEAPDSRPILKECGGLDRLLRIYENEANSEIVRRGAAEAMRQCKFNYLPHELLPGRKSLAQ